MILDADLTVPPEDLPRFYEALALAARASSSTACASSTRWRRRRCASSTSLGNKFFSLAFSWLLGQPIKDTLCGTKVLWQADYERIAANRAYFGDFDPFGDFDLLFGAAKLNLKIVDLPIRYRERTYGDDQHPALAPRLAAAQDVRLRGRADQVHLMASEPPRRWLEHPLTRGLDLDDPRTTHLRRRILAREALPAADLRGVVRAHRRLPAAGARPRAGARRRAPASSPTSCPGWCAPRSSTPPGSTPCSTAWPCPSRAGSLRGIAMTNVLHHLPRPAPLLRRGGALRPPGRRGDDDRALGHRLVAAGLHAPPPRALPARVPGLGDPGRRPALGRQRRPALDPLRSATASASSARRPSGAVRSIEPIMPFRYLVSGGVSLRGLMPAASYPLWRGLERALSPCAGRLAMFAHVVLERRAA